MCAGVKGAWKWSSHGIPGYDGGGRENSCVTFILEWYQSCSLNGIVVSFLLTLTHIDTNISQDILHQHHMHTAKPHCNRNFLDVIKKMSTSMMRRMCLTRE